MSRWNAQTQDAPGTVAAASAIYTTLGEWPLAGGSLTDADFNVALAAAEWAVGFTPATILVRVVGHDHAVFWLDQGTIRLSLLPAAAALAFVPYVPFRPLTLATPVPAWVAQAGHLLLAVPFLPLTCWAQLRNMAPAIPPHATQDPHEPFYALLAQLIGWAAIIVAAAVVATADYLDRATRQMARPKAAIATASSVPAQAAWKVSSRPSGW